ncbi:MAG: hypothetical protein ABJL54_10685 [Halioglobus sp.]
MNIEIQERNAERVRKAIQKRRELLRMYAREMPNDYELQLEESNRIIAAAVSSAYERESAVLGRAA